MDLPAGLRQKPASATEAKQYVDCGYGSRFLAVMSGQFLAANRLGGRPGTCKSVLFVLVREQGSAGDEKPAQLLPQLKRRQRTAQVYGW